METFLEHLERDRGIPAHGMLVGLVILFIAFGIDWVTKLAFVRAILKANAGHHEDVSTRLVLTQRLARVSVWVVALSLVAAQFDHLRTLGATLLASAGVVGVVVGVAARSTFANVVAGVQIAFTQPVRVGDIVTLRDETGEVEDITLTYTFIKTGDNRRLAIPNEVLSNEVVKNHSLRDPRILANAQFFVGYGADLEQVRALLIAAAKESPAWEKTSEPTVSVVDLTESAVKLKLFAWAKTAQLGADLAGQLRERGLLALQRARIDLPATRFAHHSPLRAEERPAPAPPAKA